MMMKNTALVVVLIHTLCLAPTLVTATSFSYNDDFSCSNSVALYVNSLTCGDSAVCDFGDHVEATGSMTLSQDLPDETCMQAKACFLGMACRSYDMQQVNACDRLNLESSDGYSECPAAGSYSFSVDQGVGSSRGLSLGSGWWVTIRIEVSDCDSGQTYTKCSGSFKAVSSYSNVKSFVSWSTVAVVGVALGLFIRRKRRAARIDLRAEERLVEDGRAIGHFEMMRDVGVRA